MAVPVPYLARASHDGQQLADSFAALRLDAADAAPTLWFPRSDLTTGVFDCLDRSLWTEGEGLLADHVAFDAERVELILVDGSIDDDPRDVSIKRFPTWGDASDLIAILDVRPEGGGFYRSLALSDWRRPVVEGSQMLGQAIVAAGRELPGRRVVSASMVFTRPADARSDYQLQLDPVSSGRTFGAFGVRVNQGEKTCAAGVVLVDATAPDLIRHAVKQPDVSGPYDSVPFDMSVTGRDLRVVDGAYTGDANAPVGPPTLDAWVRFRDVPDDAAIHAGLLAQFTGHMSIAAALRPHGGIGQDQAHRTLSSAINAISLSLHAEVRADRWIHFHHHSTFAGDGMTRAECRAFDEAGALLASFTVDAMVRNFADVTKSADSRTAL